MDKYDVLMNFKRQASSTPGSETGTATASASAIPSASASASASATASPTQSPSVSATPSRSASSSAAPTPSTSSNPPSTSSVAPTTSSTVPATSSTVPSSTLVTTSSSAPITSAASSTRVSASSTAPITSATSAVATSASASAVLSSTTPRTTLSVTAGTPSYIRTTSGGVIFTVTAIVGQPSASASAAAKKPFFQNTGAVVGVFVVVGVVAAALAVFIITLFIRRRRAKQFDRDVQEAAREAAQTQAPIDDDDYTGGTSYNTHASQPMSTERPGYGGLAAGYGSSGAASSWDPYARATTGTTGYEMQHRRTSTGTAPGMAGFGAGDAFARGVGVDVPQTYNQPQGYGPGYGQQGANNQGYQAYNNTSPPQAYALAQERGQGRAPPKPQMMMPEANRQNYNTVDAYRAGPSYGEAHPGEHVEYGHADNGGYGYAYSGESQGAQRQDAAYTAAPNVSSPGRQSEDPYGGYEQYDAYTQSGGSHAADTAVLPAYASGTGNVGATGDRKGTSAQAASVGRQPSGKSAATRYSQDESEGSVDERPQRRILKVANE